MTYYSRLNMEQSDQADKVYEVIKKHGSMILGDGTLLKETGLDVHSVLAVIELLSEEGKVIVTMTPKTEIPS
jgi:transcription initiation factor IIE alpha subunit